MTTVPMSHEHARRAAHAVLDYPGADGVEVLVTASTDALTRYANSEIIQNTVRNDVRATVRVLVGDRSAASATTQLDEASLLEAAARALEAAKASVPDEDSVGLPSPDEVGRAESALSARSSSA